MRIEESGATRVEAPPRDAFVVSVLDPRGRYTSGDPATKRLVLEVSTGGIPGHGHGQPDAECG